MQNGIEVPNIKVTLASLVPPGACAALNLGYIDPDQVKIEDWLNREDEGILFVPKAGERLYKIK
ncbi:MAG: hypothetical protein ACNA70_03880 [Brevefilum sp.]